MLKKILYILSSIIIILFFITFYFIPNLFGLIPGGKEINAKGIHNISFDTTSNSNYTLHYSDSEDSIYLSKLRNKYQLKSLVQNATNDLEKVILINRWVQSRWNHDGGNKPKQSDALYILSEAEKGQKFRCVEYGFVAQACLNAIGIKARILSLATKDVEEVKSGAGHIVTEAFLNDEKKWIFLDPQWDVIVTKNKKPLNAIEFQRAIFLKDSINIISNNDTLTKSFYLDWISPYLFYLTVQFDNSVNSRISMLDGILHRKKQLMLVPIGANEPHIFQRVFRITINKYTNAIKDLYSAPNVKKLNGNKNRI